MKAIIIILVIGCITVCGHIPNLVYSASFNCTKATTNVEKMICSNQELSVADSKLGLLYREALRLTIDKDRLKDEEHQWLKAVRNTCEDTNCLTKAYEERISYLESKLLEFQKLDVNSLVQKLKDKNPEVRRKAAEALGEIKDARAVKLLIAALKDENLHVRWEAAEALGKMGQHIITEGKRYRWGQYNIVMYYHVEEEGWVRIQIQIQDRRGKVLREIWSSGKVLEDDSFVELTGGGTPELHVRTFSGGASCCFVDYYFTQDGGLQNLLIFLGYKFYIHEVKDLNGDGRPELIADNGILFEFGNQTVVKMVIGWDGKRYVDQIRRYPALARQEARKYQIDLLESEDEDEESALLLKTVDKENALRYYANSLVIGEGQAARAWLLKHASRVTKEWLLSNEEDILKLLTKSTCQIRVSQERILDFGGDECME